MAYPESRTLSQLKPSPAPSPRSVTRTLRIDEDVEARIVAMAEKQQLSFNLLANKALRRLVEWEDKAEKFGFVNVPLPSIKRVFSAFTDDEARELGRESGKNLLPEMILFWFKRLDQNTALKTLELIGGYGRWFRFELTADGRSDVVVLKHDRGPRVSAYNAELLKSLFESLGALVETHETDDQVVAKITYQSITSTTKPTEIFDASLSPSKNGQVARLKTAPIAVRASLGRGSSRVGRMG